MPQRHLVSTVLVQHLPPISISNSNSNYSIVLRYDVRSTSYPKTATRPPSGPPERYRAIDVAQWPPSFYLWPESGVSCSPPSWWITSAEGAASIDNHPISDRVIGRPLCPLQPPRNAPPTRWALANKGSEIRGQHAPVPLAEVLARRAGLQREWRAHGSAPRATPAWCRMTSNEEPDGCTRVGETALSTKGSKTHMHTGAQGGMALHPVQVPG